jgi:hypothetical protein
MIDPDDEGLDSIGTDTLMKTKRAQSGADCGKLWDANAMLNAGKEPAAVLQLPQVSEARIANGHFRNLAACGRLERDRTG